MFDSVPAAVQCWRECDRFEMASAQYLGRFRREAYHGLEASGYVDARIDPANVRRSGRTRQPTFEQEFKPAVVTAAAECAAAPAMPAPHLMHP